MAGTMGIRSSVVTSDGFAARSATWRVACLGAFSVGGTLSGGCGEPPDVDPVPVISGLVCEVQTPVDDDGYYDSSFSFRYVDEDDDLGGGAVMWWVDDVPQPDLLPNTELGTTGTLTLSLSGFPTYEELSVRFQVVDAAGNASNSLYADMVTVPGSESCAEGTEGE